MNLIEKLGLEKCKAIVDGAPEWAKSYCIEAADYWNEESKYPCCVNVSDLKSEIDHHYYGRSEAEELAAYAELSQEKIEGGAMLVGDNSKVIQMVRDITDHCSDIKNHISPNTKVIER